MREIFHRHSNRLILEFQANPRPRIEGIQHVVIIPGISDIFPFAHTCVVVGGLQRGHFPLVFCNYFLFLITWHQPSVKSGDAKGNSPWTFRKLCSEYLCLNCVFFRFLFFPQKSKKRHKGVGGDHIETACPVPLTASRHSISIVLL